MGDPLTPKSDLSHSGSDSKRPVAISVLESMPDFMSRDRDSRQRPAFKVVLGQSDDFIFRTIVVADRCGFNAHVLEVGQVQNMASELAAGAREILSFLGMTAHDHSRPGHGPEANDQENDAADDSQHRSLFNAPDFAAERHGPAAACPCSIILILADRRKVQAHRWLGIALRALGQDVSPPYRSRLRSKSS
jgi:hypothetical protein